MFISRYKSLFIFILVCLALYQTAVLWFGYLSPSDKNIKAYDETFQYMGYTIRDMLICTGDNRFYNINDSVYIGIIDNALKNTVENGKIYSNQTYEGIPSEKGAVVYEMEFNFPSDEMKSVFNISGDFEKKLDSFDRIEIIPDINLPKKITVRFVDRKNDLMCCFELKNTDLVTDFFYITDGLSFENNIMYRCPDSENKEFIPCWEGNFFKYNGVKMVNPIESESGILLMSLEKNVNIFFENPALKRTSVVNKVYTYTDDNTVVKYYTNGILEYSSYAVSTTTENSFYTALMSAIDFIKSDSAVTNDFYLSSVEERGKRIKFGFNYKINNIDIRLSEDYSESLGMDSFIEVTVSGNDIIKYSRLIYNLENTNDISFVNVSDDEVLNKTADKYAELLYIVDETKDIQPLVWLTESGKTESSYRE